MTAGSATGEVTVRLHPDDDVVVALADLPAGPLRAPDGAAVVRLRFFAGLSVVQTAAALGLSASTVDRRWAFARAWLYRQLHGEE